MDANPSLANNECSPSIHTTTKNSACRPDTAAQHQLDIHAYICITLLHGK